MYSVTERTELPELGAEIISLSNVRDIEIPTIRSIETVSRNNYISVALKRYKIL